jgi:hypothetical protein
MVETFSRLGGWIGKAGSSKTVAFFFVKQAPSSPSFPPFLSREYSRKKGKMVFTSPGKVPRPQF